MTEPAPQALAADFPPADHAGWRSLVDSVLKGAPFDRVLVSRTYDGIELQPLYERSDDHRPAPTRSGVGSDGSDGGWDICCRVDDPSPQGANAAALADLDGGATSLEVALDIGGTGEVDGVVVSTVDDLDLVLEGVMLDIAGVRLAAGSSGGVAATLLAGVWERRGVAPTDRLGSLGIDPLGALAETGYLAQGLDAALTELGEQAAWAVASPGVTAATVDVTPYAAAGASEGQEIAAALSTAVAYVKAMGAAGLSVDDAAGSLEVVLSADSDIYATVAKIRALRVCWAHLLDAAGASEPGAELSVVVRTNPSSLMSRDVWVNLLRITAGCFAAAVGGAQSVIAAPFDQPIGSPDGLARRMARNTQLVLCEESNLGRVADPAHGSWFVEQFTDDLVAAAWAEFTAIEASGGMAAALREGSIQQRVIRTAEQRRERVATRRDPLTGLSEFPFLEEPEVERDDIDREAARAATSGVAEPGGPATHVDELVVAPRGNDFEVLRDRSDLAVAHEGRRPQIFVATLGPLASHTARVAFATNLFEAGGISAVNHHLDDDTDAALVAAFTESETPLAVICGSDGSYGERASDTARALKAAGASWVCLAGAPGDAEAEYRAAGIDHFIRIGVDVIDTVSAALDAAGVSR